MITSVFLGCVCFDWQSKPIDKAEVYGIYVANFGEGAEYIILKPDSSYIHSITLYNGVTFIDSNYYEMPWWDEPISAISVGKAHLSKGGLEFTGDCGQYSLVLFDFKGRTMERVAYTARREGTIDTTTFTWSTCLYKRNGRLLINYDDSFRQYYMKMSK
jgi:hypothetical protein